MTFNLTPEQINAIQSAAHHSTIVEDVAQFLQMFSQIRDENMKDPFQVPSKPQPNVDARVKFEGLKVSATASAGSTLVLDSKAFEFKIDSIGDAGENISVKAEIDPTFVFGHTGVVNAESVTRSPEQAFFDMHLSLTFDKCASCARHSEFMPSCETCARAAKGYAFSVHVNKPSLYIPPEAVRSAVQFAWEYDETRQQLAKQVCSFIFLRVYFLTCLQAPVGFKKLTEELRERFNASLAARTKSKEKITVKAHVETFLARMPLLDRTSVRRASSAKCKFIVCCFLLSAMVMTACRLSRLTSLGPRLTASPPNSASSRTLP